MNIAFDNYVSVIRSYDGVEICWYFAFNRLAFGWSMVRGEALARLYRLLIGHFGPVLPSRGRLWAQRLSKIRNNMVDFSIGLVLIDDYQVRIRILIG